MRTVPMAAVIVAAALAGATSVHTAPQAPAKRQAPSPRAPIDAAMLDVQIRLARAHFSPGEIDGHAGTNTSRALAEWAEATRHPADAGALATADPAPTLVPYTIAAADVAGPFEPNLPADLMAQATLPALPFRSAIEALGEQFHVAPDTLRAINPEAEFAEGETIQVPNVTAPPIAGPAAKIVVSKSASLLVARAADGSVLATAPVTSGSEHDPLPIGSWAVTAVVKNPTFNYNPDLFWDADASHAKAKIPAGPNNPVGVVWIDITKPHYGLHGTPEPGKIGHTTSHGCVRLTNWDALTIAGLVAKGTPVVFIE